MGTGYTRNDASNNIADGNVINASDLDGEFDAVESAFGTSGHTHDGTAAEGGAITKVGPVQDIVVSATNVNPKTNNAIDLGTASLKYKDAHFQGSIDTDGVITAATFEPDGDTAAGDNAAIGYTAAEGLILTGQGSTNDVTIKNDADADVLEIPTGTTNVTVVGDITSGGTLNVTGDTAAGDAAAIGYTAAEGLILTGQGSTSDITLKNDADAVVFTVPTGTDDILFPDNAKAMFGTGSDLSIFHDGTNTTISNETGDLKLQSNEADKDVLIQTDDGSGGRATYIMADGSTGATKLFFAASGSSSTKLTTTNTGVDITGGFTATDGSTITVDDNSVALELICTDTDASQGPILRLSRNVAGAASDVIGTIHYYGEDVAGNNTQYAEIEGRIEDATNGAEDGTLVLSTMVAGTSRDRITINSTETVLNEGSQDLDFRVESNGDANMLFVDAGNDRVGIGLAIPDSFLHLKNSDSTAYSATATDGQVGVGPTIYLENPANTNTTVGGQIVFGMRSTEEQARIGATGGTAPALTFGTGDVERMRLTNDGRAGIGTNSPSHLLDVEGSGDVVIRVGSTGTGDADAALHIDGGDTGESFIRFDTDGTEGARISMTGGAGGDLNIQTAASSGRKIDFEPNDTLTMQVVTPASGTNTTGIIEFFADSTSAGKISAIDGDLVIGEDAVGIKFENTGTDRIIPVNVDTLATRSAAIDLGGSSERFKDLHLSGQAAIGGNVLVGKTSADVSTVGVEALSTGTLNARAAEGPVLDLRRGSSSSSELIATFRDDSTGMIKIGESGGAGYIEGRTGDTGLKFEGAHIRPRDNQADADNAIDLGNSSFRFDDIFATNSTINTSDRNEKQDIAALTDAEITAAKAISKLFKNFKWNDRVAEKGDAARTHTGIIAQEVEQAMTDAGLSANNYAFFISATWWETQTEVPAIEAVAEVTETTTDEDGNEVVTVVTKAVEARDAYTRTDTYETAEEAPEGATERNRKGIRYTELLSFIGAATEQRLTSIELRLAALETE